MPKKKKKKETKTAGRRREKTAEGLVEAAQRSLSGHACTLHLIRETLPCMQSFGNSYTRRRRNGAMWVQVPRVHTQEIETPVVGPRRRREREREREGGTPMYVCIERVEGLCRRREEGHEDERQRERETERKRGRDRGTDREGDFEERESSQVCRESTGSLLSARMRVSHLVVSEPQAMAVESVERHRVVEERLCLGMVSGGTEDLKEKTRHKPKEEEKERKD